MKRFIFLTLVFVSIYQFSTAQEDFSSSIKAANKALSNSNYKEALGHFEAAFSGELPDSATVSWNAGLAGICAQEIQDEDKAISFFKMAIDHKTGDIDIYDRLREIAGKRKDVNLEEYLLLSEIKVFPDLVQKNTNKLLYLYFNSQQYEKTVSIADEILAVTPQKTQTLYLKSMALHQLGQTEAAIKELLSLLASDPGNVKANSLLGIIYYQKAEKAFDTFTNNYNNLAKPTRVDYSKYMKNILTCNPEYQKALKYLLKAYEQNKDNAIRAAIYNSYIRLEQKAKAENYK